MRTLVFVACLMAALPTKAEVLVVRDYLNKRAQREVVVRLVFPREGVESCEAMLMKQAEFLARFMKEKRIPSAKVRASSESEEEDPNAPVLCTVTIPQTLPLFSAVLQNMAGLSFETLPAWDLAFKKRVLRASPEVPKVSKKPTSADLKILLNLFTRELWTGHGLCRRFQTLAQGEEDTTFEDDRFKPSKVTLALAYIDSIERDEQLAPIEEFSQDEYGWEHCIRKFKTTAKWDDPGSVYSMLTTIIDHIAAKPPAGVVRAAYVTLLQQLLPVFFVKAANIRVMLDALKALNDKVPGIVVFACQDQKDYPVLDSPEDASKLGAFGPQYDCGRGIFSVRRKDGSSTLVLGYNPQGFVHTEQKYRDLAKAEEEAIEKLRNE